MGQGAEDANIAAEVLEGLGVDPDRFYGTRKSARRHPRFVEVPEAVHSPVSDAEAKALIERLEHFEWETHKVSGRFARNPYSITATVAGVRHRVNLPGRFGGVLRWLDSREREIAGAAA